MGGKFFLAVIAILPTLTCSVFGQGRSSLAEAMFSDSEKSSDGGPTISVVEFVDTDILDVFKIISDATGWSIFASKSAKAKVSLWVKDITALELLDRAVSAAGLVYHRDKKLITVMSMDEYAAAFGLEKTIVSLKHAAAPDVASTIAAFLTAEGKLSVQESANRIAVLDTTAAMAEIARLVSILDVPSSMAQVEIVELCHRKAIELVPLLNAYFHASESARTSPVTSGTQHQQPSAASVSTGTPRVLSAPFAFHADEQTNHLVLVGIAADRQLVKDVIEKMDVPSAAEVRTYPVHNVDAREIFDALEEFFRRDSEGRESLEPADRLRVALGEQTNSITVYGASSDHIKAEALIESMDIPIPEGPGRIKVYRLENTSADSVAQLLIDLIGSEQAEASDAERPSGLGVAGVESAAAPPAGGPTREPSPASPGLEPQTLEGAGISQVQRPRVAVAPEANAVVVWATPTDQQTLASLIEQIDERRAQVLIEAILLELTGDDDLAIGVELESLQPGTYRDTGTLFFTTFGLSTVDPATGLRAPLGAPGMSTAIIRPAEVPFILHALQTTGNARILSHPKILVNDNAQGAINSVREEPFTSVNASETVATTSFGGFVQAGIQFAITPHISAANYLRLEYQIQLNSFVGPPMQTGEVTIPPPRDTNLVQSEATVPDGHTIIIGGLRRTIDQETIDKVPLLGDVPLLGYLFRNRIRTNTTSTLYVFIRPLILRDDRFRDLKLISDEEVAATDMDRDWPQNPAVAIGSGEHRDPWESPTIPHLPAGE